MQNTELWIFKSAKYTEFSLEYEYVFRFTDQKLLGLQLSEGQLLLLLYCELTGPHQQHSGGVSLNSFILLYNIQYRKITKMHLVNHENPQIIGQQCRYLLGEVLSTMVLLVPSFLSATLVGIDSPKQFCILI